MNRIKQLIITSLLFLPFVFLKTLSAQPTQKEVAKLFQPDEKQIPSPDFSKIDNYVLGLQIKKKITEAELVEMITQQSQTKLEKARAIFIWIANNIAYDTNYSITSKEEALRRGKGVCQAYSGLFESFGKLAGLDVVTVSGDAKDFLYRHAADIDKRGHAWNVVKVDDGRQILVDATWGAGHVNNRVFTRELAVYWFDPTPEIFVFTHFPNEEKWQLLDKPVARDVFLQMPPLSPNLVSWGFNPVATFSYFTKNKDIWFPFVYSVDTKWKINMMPVCSELKVGESYNFEFVVPQNEEIAIICNNKDWVHLNKDGDKFSVTFTPEKRGTAILAVKQPTGKFGGVFKYDVK